MKYQINLLSRKKDNVTNKIFYFVSNYLRYILVITQLLVIIVFFYRFKIDQNIIDTNEAVLQKQEILEISKPLIAQAVQFDLEINEVKKILKTQEGLTQIVEYLTSRFPKNLYLTKIEILQGSIKFEGKTTDLISLESFNSRLKKENKFKSIILTSMQKKLGEVYYAFELKDYTEK